MWNNHPWQGEKKPADFYVVKGILEGLFEEFGVSEAYHFRQAQLDGMHPGRTAEILLDDKVIGFAGQMHPQVQKDMDLTKLMCLKLRHLLFSTYDLPALNMRQFQGTRLSQGISHWW